MTDHLTSNSLLIEWLTFAEDVMASCAAGDDWLRGLIARTEAALQQPAHEPETAPSPVNARTTEVRRDPRTRNAGESREAGEAAGDGAAQPPSVDLHEVERLLQRAEIGQALAIIQRATGAPQTKGESL